MRLRNSWVAGWLLEGFKNLEGQSWNISLKSLIWAFIGLDKVEGAFDRCGNLGDEMV